LLVHQSIQTAARNAAANKNINQKITRWATPNRFVFSGYIKRYMPLAAVLASIFRPKQAHVVF
jgi:hypothetical protein